MLLDSKKSEQHDELTQLMQKRIHFNVIRWLTDAKQVK